MAISLRINLLIVALAGQFGLTALAQPPDPLAALLLADANGSRVKAGVKRLHWDDALAKAAMKHCERMASEGPIAHRYAGEEDVAARAEAAGARFSLIEENVAVSSDPGRIHESWMNSPEHRKNLLSPDVDAVGIAVVEARGVLYAVADYERRVPDLSRDDVETAVAVRLRAHGITVLPDAVTARAACASDREAPQDLRPLPALVVHWQGADLDHLPASLLTSLKSGQYHQAAVGACPARNVEGGFTAYRVAVLLYGGSASRE